MKNTKNFPGLADNFEIESRRIEFCVSPEASFSDLTDAEKEEIFGKDTFELEFNISDAFEMTR